MRTCAVGFVAAAMGVMGLSTVHALVPQGIYKHHEGWIDPDTPEEDRTLQVPAGPYSFGPDAKANMTYQLIFSDEFNDGNRTFEAGFDRRWTAIDQLDTTNMGQHYFRPQAVQIDDGDLIITTTKPKKLYKGARYVSGSLQSWNKFCFTGGFVDIQAVLPGKWGIPGTWPALWIMGNLGRAAFLGSQNGMWPWSYDYCAPWIDKYEDQPQKVSACGNLTDKDDPDSYPERYDLNPFQGRGATEIDIIEAQIRARDQPAFISTSLQIRPALRENLRPSPGTLPRPGQWYQDLKFGNYTKINSDYYGDAGLDSISAVTQLNTDAFLAYHRYQIDWSPGPYGYLRWFLDGNFLFEIPGAALDMWSEGVPPRMIPTEPSYLILSTAVSERFSPPCEGEICDSLWPSNFTIDYVRVYQGNPNNYTSIGCNPTAFPTAGWVDSHPVEFGLPWYSSLNIARASTFFFAAAGAVFSLFIAFNGRHHPRLCAGYVGTLGFTAGFFALFSYESVQQMVWAHVAIACLCGVVCGGLCCLVPVGSLGAFLGLYVALWIVQFASPLLARMICVVLVATGISLQYVGVRQKTVVILSTSLVGSLSFLVSFSHWFGSGQVASNLWSLVGFAFGGHRDEKATIFGKATGDYLALLVTSVVSLVYQFIVSRHVSTIWEKPHKSRFPKVSASSHARTLKPEESSAENINFFAPRKLPPNMQKFSPIFRIAQNVQQSYGFQEDSFRNQTEHIVMLLTNTSRKGGNPYRKLHDLVFSNYVKWCRKLRIQPLQWSESKPSQGSLSSVDEMSVDLCLFFFIWGEAGNLRHCPEYLCYLFHKMKEEYPAVRHTTRDSGFFLDTVITPVYNLIRAQMGSKLDHQYRHNYDDLNEFFWKADCLKFDYKYEEVNESMSPGPMKFFAQLDRANFHPVIYRGKKSIAEAISESSKTFFEKRQWLSSLRAFNRIVEFHIVAFHVLVALAFAEAFEYDIWRSLELLSSALLTPFVLAILWDGLDIIASYQPEVSLSTLARPISRIILHSVVAVIAVGLYRFAWINGGAAWTTFYIVALILHIPNVFSAMLQVMPGFNTWLRQTHWKPISFLRHLLHPMHGLYVGDNVLDPASVSFGYQFFWVSLLSWKLFFSYKFEITPLVIPTFLLYADYVENHVSVITTAFLIFLNWLPFFFVFCIDTTIWNSIWNAFTGTFVGFSSHIGEVRNFRRVRAGFSRAADMFNSKLVSPFSKTGARVAQAKAEGQSTYGTAIGGREVLISEVSPSNRPPNGETPLLSFARRRQTSEEARTQRRLKWHSFSVAWDAIVDCMRADDLISNKEKALLGFQRIENYQREIYLPMFQLAGSFEYFTSNVQELFADGDDLSERDLQDKLLELLGSHAMVEETIEELWELTVWLLVNIMGPCHTNDIRYICSALSSWVSCGVFRTLKLQRIGDCGKALADVVSLVLAHIGTWKSNAKTIPVRKSPADYSSYQFPQGGVNTLRPIRGGLSKSASTTGLSSLALGGNVPRRSRGSGVARIGAMGHGAMPKPTRRVTHSIPSAHISQLRDKLRAFLNLTKSMLNTIDESDPLYGESRGVSDRLTWILTQERGFMWDDDYCGEQLTLTAYEPSADTVVRHIHGLLTLQRIDAEPKSIDAKRRLLFFMNSLFMDMPTAPMLEEMKSWSVVTPFYGEDVLYSKSDLETKRDGLDVHTLLFLQTLYKEDWENFLERVKPKKNLWKDPETAMELRLWASLRGQTLARTVQGMMYYEAAIRLLADIEEIPVEGVEDLVKTKFSYVVACQIYGRQKRNNDPKARDIEFLLHRFPNLRVAYIDEIRVNYQKEQSYYAVLIKSGPEVGNVEEIYRVRLPGNPILGEGKPENQNTAIIFTRGENLQTIDMNQDGYIEEALKMRNALEEFDSGLPDRPYTIVGLPEHIFTGSVSSLANYMALQETSFVTLGQRTLARPLRIRLHYGHPDVFNKLFFMTRGGISKASKGINLSEDIFAGFNNCLRGGSVKFPEYTRCGKGRDVGMQQIYKFEAKLAQGAAEQSLSRDVYRLAQRLDFFKLLSFYFNHVGFYLSMSMIIWTVYILLYCNLFRAILTIEGIGGRDPVIMSTLQVMLGTVAFFTTAPMFATISVENGFKAATKEVFRIIVTGGPLYFLFHIGTKWFYFGQTILAGGAKYRATGRGFVTKHSRFDELYRFYASSHLYSSVEIATALILYYFFTVGTQYFAMTWSLWLVVASWAFSPFWFNPLAFEWSDVTEDGRVWLKWMRGDGGNPEQSWQAWFKEENSYFVTLPFWAKACVALKGLLFAAVGLALASTGDPYHSIIKESTVVPWSICILVLGLYAFVSFVFFGSEIETGFARIMKMVIVLITLVLGVIAIVTVDGMRECLFSLAYLSTAIGCWGLLLFGTNSRFVRTLYFAQDIALGGFALGIILILSALFVPGKIQTWLLYNNALSRGVVIEDILRSNARTDDRDDDLSLQQMRAIIAEQQHIISALTTSSSGSDNDNSSEVEAGKKGIAHTLSDHTLHGLRNVSETELAALVDGNRRIQAVMQQKEEKPTPRVNAPSKYSQPMSARAMPPRAHSSSDAGLGLGMPLPPTVMPLQANATSNGSANGQNGSSYNV